MFALAEAAGSFDADALGQSRTFTVRKTHFEGLQKRWAWWIWWSMRREFSQLSWISLARLTEMLKELNST